MQCVISQSVQYFDYFGMTHNFSSEKFLICYILFLKSGNIIFTWVTKLVIKLKQVVKYAMRNLHGVFVVVNGRFNSVLLLSVFISIILCDANAFRT